MKSPKLIIPIDQIPAAGLDREGELPPEWIAESLLPPYQPLQPLSFEVTLTRINDNVHVHGKMATSLSFRCGRTLEQGVMPLSITFDELFQPANRHRTNLGDGVDSEAIGDEPYLYTDGQVDLTPILREELVIAQPPYPTVSGTEHDAKKPVWTSHEDDIDPRWNDLKNLKLN